MNKLDKAYVDQDKFIELHAIKSIGEVFMDLRQSGSANIPQFNDFALQTCSFFGEYAKNVGITQVGLSTYIIGAMMNL